MNSHCWKRNSKFSSAEDSTLSSLVKKYGEDDWEKIASLIKNRNARQCHDRWFYYLSPNINREPFTEEEDKLLLSKVKKIGFHWVLITSFFQGRTDTQIKNRYNLLKRKKEAEIEAARKLKKEQASKQEEKEIKTEAVSCVDPDNVEELITSVIESSWNHFSSENYYLFL